MLRRLVIPLALCIAVLVAAATVPAHPTAPKQDRLAPQRHLSQVEHTR